MKNDSMNDNMLIEPVIKPTNRDVINGRGKGIHSLPGNIKYRKLCEANKVSCLKGYCMQINSRFSHPVVLLFVIQELYARWVLIMSLMVTLFDTNSLLM
jgi:hypothetical protein